MINENLLDIAKVRAILNLFLESSKRKPNDLSELIDSILDALNDKNFSKDALKHASKWIEVDYEILKETITNYLSKV